MGLIGSIKYIENRFGGRKHQSKGKSVQKNTRNDAVDEKNVQPNACHSLTEYDTRLGRKVNITA